METTNSNQDSRETLEEWVRAIAEPEVIEEAKHSLSVVVFRLGGEWLAFPTIYCKEITHRRCVHSIPHRTNNFLQGIVNLNGELQLHVALHELLQIPTSISFQTSRIPYQRNRMMAIVKEGELWTFSVDEVDGIYRWDLLKLESISEDVQKSRVGYIKGKMKMENKTIGLLDEELVFASLKRIL